MILDLNKIDGLKPKSGGGYIGRCPSCFENGIDKNKMNHLYINANGTFGCVVDTSPEHYRRIEELAGAKGGKAPIEQPYRHEESVIIDKIYPESALLRLLPDTRYWNGRGISNETLSKFKGGLAHSGSFRFYFVIPVYNEQNQIIGWTGRFTLDETKYKKPKVRHHGRKSKWLFPLHLNKAAILAKREVVVTEGLADVLSLFEAGIDNCLCLFGSSLSPKLLTCLIALNLRCLIISTNNEPDNNNIGNNAALKIKEKLSKFYGEEKIIIHLPDRKDINEMLVKDGKDKVKEWYEKIPR